MLRSDPKDAALRWQAFLIDGFDDWLPAATIAASNMVKGTARDVLRSMISAFYFPEGIQQTPDDISSWMESYAYNINAKVRDPKTGEIVGYMREIVDSKKGRKPKQSTTPRKKTPLDLKREARRKAAQVKVQAQQEPAQ